MESGNGMADNLSWRGGLAAPFTRSVTCGYKWCIEDADIGTSQDQNKKISSDCMNEWIDRAMEVINGFEQWRNRFIWSPSECDMLYSYSVWSTTVTCWTLIAVETTCTSIFTVFRYENQRLKFYPNRCLVSAHSKLILKPISPTAKFWTWLLPVIDADFNLMHWIAVPSTTVYRVTNAKSQKDQKTRTSAFTPHQMLH